MLKQRTLIAATIGLMLLASRATTAAETESEAAPGLDIAPFGRVATWDPKRIKGTAASRVQEFPAEDIRTARDLDSPAPAWPVPNWDGVGCIGMHWDENRLLRRLAMDFVKSSEVPRDGEIELQAWEGESAWQGSWVRLTAVPKRAETSLEWTIDDKSLPRGTQKVRWLFTGLDRRQVEIAGLAAYTRSELRHVDVRFESSRPRPGQTAKVVVYNGYRHGLLHASESGTEKTWDLAEPLTLGFEYSVPTAYKAERTVLRIQMPEGPICVAIEDLLANDCVHIPEAGLFVTRDPQPITLADYLKRIAGKQTVLEQVRAKPVQDFAQAMKVVHNPIQDRGPMMLSLACDNRKFIVERDGTVAFDLYDKPDDPPRDRPTDWKLVPHFGDGKNTTVERHLDGGWLPMPITNFTEGNIVYRQATMVAPADDPTKPLQSLLRERSVCRIEYTICNKGPKPEDVNLVLSFATGTKQQPELKPVKEGFVALNGDRVVAFIDTRSVGPLTAKIDPTGFVLSGRLPALSAGTRCQTCAVMLPAWKLDANKYADLAEQTCWDCRTFWYWDHEVLGTAMQVEVPDPLLTNVIRASQVHCLIAARNDDSGNRTAPWIAASAYGPLESEANSAIRGMDMMGHDEFARRSLDFFIKRYNKAGFLTSGYTLVGTGEHLWTLAEYVERSGNLKWLEANAPEIVRVCHWVIAQRTKTKRLDARGQKVPEYGLMPPGVTADWNRYAYRFYNDAQYCHGLETIAAALAQIKHPEAEALAKEARDYREDLLRAYRWTQARSPVVKLDDGTWTPAAPALLDCFGRVEDFLPAEDGNRTWCYSIEIGAHHLAATGILDPKSDEVGRMMDYLEDVQFLRTGMGEYPETKNRQDVFDFGGFAKVQPYYGRFAEVYAARDDVKPFLRSYFNSLAAMLNTENLSLWEHFHNQGAWNKTHETGWFLCQTRTMLVQERGDELWLAPMIPAEWLDTAKETEPAKQITVRNAPTRFGKVSYTIITAADGHIEATIQPPDRTPPKRIVLCLRGPECKSIYSVTLNGKAHEDFDPKKQLISMVPAAGRMDLQVHFILND